MGRVRVGMQSVQANGIECGYLLEGPADAPVVAFSNSLASDVSIWEGVVSSLRGEYRVLRYDLRGHGVTPATCGEYSISLLAQDFVALLDALQLGRVHMVGLSIGGMVAQQVAATAPQRIASVVLCATASESQPDLWQSRMDAARQGGIGPMVEGTLQRWFTASTRERNPDLVRATGHMISRTSVEGYAGCAAALRDLNLTPLLGDIRAPALLIAGDEDASTPASAMEEIRKRIPGARLVVLPSAAHMLPLERPKELAGLIMGFLERVR